MRYFCNPVNNTNTFAKKPDTGGIPAIENKINVKDNASKGFALDKLTNYFRKITYLIVLWIFIKT